MIAGRTRLARPSGGGPDHAGARPGRVDGGSRRVDGSLVRDDAGFLSLEWVLTLPVVAVLAALVLCAGFVIRDVLVLQEAARVGARVASTTSGDLPVRWAVADAAPELADGPLTVRVSPPGRTSGDQVQVEVTARRRYGPLTHELRARSTARVEPVVEHGPVAPPSPLRPQDPTARRPVAP